MPLDKIEIVHRRHRPGAVRHGHLWLALARRRRHRARQGAPTRSSPRARRSPRICSRRASGDIEFEDGKFAVAGTDRSEIVRRDRARRAYVPHNYPLDVLEPGLDETGVLRSGEFHLSRRRHICRSRDRSGDRRRRARSLSPRWTTSARVINPMIVEGQLHGGIAQGVGQALFENCVYDDDSGQLLSGSFMDYCMPRADNMPNMKIVTQSTLCTHTPLGREGMRRGRHHRLARGRDQRRGRRAVASRRQSCRHAGDAEPDLAHHSETPRCCAPPNRSRRR